MGGRDPAGDLRRGEPFAERGEHGPVRVQRDRAGAADERDLVRVLRHPAAGGHPGAARETRRGQCRREAVGERERHRLLDPEPPAAGAPLPERGGDERIRRLVLLPRAHVVADPDLLARALLLERGRHPHRIARPGDDAAEEALGQPPLRAGEVGEARSGTEDERVETGLDEPLSRLLQACAVLLRRHRRRRVGERGERADGRRQVFGPLRGGRRRRAGAERRRRSGRELEGTAPAEGHGFAGHDRRRLGCGRGPVNVRPCVAALAAARGGVLRSASACSDRWRAAGAPLPPSSRS